MISYRKQKDGKWCVMGPRAEVRIGIIRVTKSSGATKNEEVTGLSKPFDVDGVAHVYGYIKERPRIDGPPCPRCGKSQLLSRYKEGETFCPDKQCRALRAASKTGTVGSKPNRRAKDLSEILAEAGMVATGPAVTFTQPLGHDKKAGAQIQADSTCYVGKQWQRKDGSLFLIVGVTPIFLHTADQCDDQDCFCGKYGWKVCFDACPVAPADTHVPDCQPDHVTGTCGAPPVTAQHLDTVPVAAPAGPALDMGDDLPLDE